VAAHRVDERDRLIFEALSPQKILRGAPTARLATGRRTAREDWRRAGYVAAGRILPTIHMWPQAVQQKKLNSGSAALRAGIFSVRGAWHREVEAPDNG